MLGLGGKVRLSGKLWPFYLPQAQSMFHGLGLLKPAPCKGKPRLILVSSVLGL